MRDVNTAMKSESVRSPEPVRLIARSKPDPEHAPAGELLVRVDGACVRVGRRELIRDVSLGVRTGEVVTVLGPNGGGKTTLLKALLGLIPLTHGKVWRRRGLKVGYVPQRLTIDPTLPLPVHRLLTLTRRAPRDAVLRVLDEVGARHLVDDQVHTLSGGELQRVLLARALLGEPHLLVLDEPAQGVDHRGQRALYEHIEQVAAARGCGVVLVSHDLNLILAASRKVVCLDVTIRCQGGPDVIRTDPAYADLIGEGPGALGLYRHDPVQHALRDAPPEH